MTNVNLLWRLFLTAVVAALLSAVLFLTGCSRQADLPAEAEGKTVVTATIFPLADWARKIGGERVYVETLLPSGASPHTFDPSPREMRLIASSKLFLRTGLGMDDWGAKLAKSGEANGLKVLSVGDLIASADGLPTLGADTSSTETLGASHVSHDHDHGDVGDGHHHHHHHHAEGGVNPHFWLDPIMAAESVKLITTALVDVDPAGKELFEANSAKYLGELERLDIEVQKSLSGVERRQFVSFHDAYPYLAQRYGLQIAAVIEEYPGKTPSEGYIREVTTRLRELGIKTVFSEPQLNPHVAEIIAREIGGRVDILDPYGAEVYEDRNSYLKLVRYNVSRLKRALSAE